ncbi:hypothetical protein M3573_18735 [Bacillus safensis]|uniref:hypothetical protein n=1 Tax=Bacillus safensis TaxID=561879 RepID=UPI00203B2AE5|nr:hypothetical protein [Bacillus safensis]MCM3140314.1 hypothetical protein [Bacillus safensis]
MFESNFDRLFGSLLLYGVPILLCPFGLSLFFSEGTSNPSKKVEETNLSDPGVKELGSLLQNLIDFFVTATFISILAAVTFFVFIKVFKNFPKRSLEKRKQKDQLTLFNTTNYTLKEYEALLEKLKLLDETNSDTKSCASHIFQDKRIISKKDQLSLTIKKITTYLSGEKEEGFSLGKYPDVFNRISGEFFSFNPSVDEFTREYQTVKKLELENTHIKKVISMLQDIIDCLNNFESRISPEFEQEKRLANELINVDLDRASRNIKFEKSYLTGQEQLPELTDLYEKRDPQFKEIIELDRASKLIQSISSESLSLLTKHPEASSTSSNENTTNHCTTNSSYNHSSNYDHSSSYDSGYSGSGCDI